VREGLKKKMMYFIGVFLLWFVVHSLLITFDGLNDHLELSDVAVVLGNKVELDGKPSKRLQGRLDRTVELYKDHYFTYIIVSGGTGIEGFDEAVVMQHYLIDKGIPTENIILDQQGYNSLMTAQHAKVIMKDRNFHSVTIISQFYHLSRTKLAFRKVGIENQYTAHAKYYEIRDFYSLTREFFAYYKYLLQ
jgi:vancomycin permeability regulator SanA